MIASFTQYGLVFMDVRLRGHDEFGVTAPAP
jgi:hypothetical protein